MSTGPLPDSCTVLSEKLDEQLAGSAPRSLGWVALEQNGPWGAKAFTESHLDPVLGRAIESAAAVAGVRPCLIRRPGRHADLDRTARRVLVAHTDPARTWLLAGQLSDPAAVLELDWEAVASGDVEAVHRSLPGLSRTDESHLLVCTNGRRDVCCATVGRPVAQAAALTHPERVWEVTHTSGHRFAPTAVLLPHGTLHGRLDGAAATGLLVAADRGETVLAGARGRSTWSGPEQVAELAVREATGELLLDALTVHAAPDGDAVVVAHADGRRWRVRVGRQPTGAQRPESCGKAFAEMYRHTVEELTAL